MADNDREALAAILAEHLPVTDTRPFGDETEGAEVFIEGFAELNEIADAILGRWKLVPIPPPQPPHVPPELAADTGDMPCAATTRDSPLKCQRPCGHPGRHYAQDTQGFIVFITEREAYEIEREMWPL